jgi:hypothetical protein
VARLPFAVGHAVDDLPRLLLRHLDAGRAGRVAIPVGEAVAAEAGEIHQVDVLHVGARAKVREERAERRRLEVALLVGIEIGHGGLLHTAPVREPWRSTSVDIGSGVDDVNDRRQAHGPGAGAGFVGDQVLADLDEHVRVAVDDRMPEHGVAAQRPVIGLVVADDDVAGLAQHVDHRQRGARIEVPQHAGVPRPGDALHHRREGMDRDDERRLAGFPGDRRGQRGHRIVVGAVVALEPALALLRRHRVVSGNDRAVVELADQGRIFLAPVGIDQQAREAGEDGRRVEFDGERARHHLDADVVGDVAFEFGRRQAEIAVFLGERPAGVVGDEHDAPQARTFDDLEGSEGYRPGHVKRQLAAMALS